MSLKHLLEGACNRGLDLIIILAGKYVAAGRFAFAPLSQSQRCERCQDSLSDPAVAIDHPANPSASRCEVNQGSTRDARCSGNARKRVGTITRS